MLMNFKVALAALAGIAIGAAGGRVLSAQEVKTPPGYIFAELEITDPDAIGKYAQKVPETLAPFNHHYVLRGGKIQALEGEAPKLVVQIAFDSADKAREWYDSAAYSAIKPIRQSAARTRMFIVEGVAPQ